MKKNKQKEAVVAILLFKICNPIQDFLSLNISWKIKALAGMLKSDDSEISTHTAAAYSCQNHSIHRLFSGCKILLNKTTTILGYL